MSQFDISSLDALGLKNRATGAERANEAMEFVTVYLQYIIKLGELFRSVNFFLSRSSFRPGA